MNQRQRIDSRGSLERLERLIEARLQPGADKARIDQRIWDLFGEDWCVMFTDLSGFSRRVAEFGIIDFLQTIHESERLLIPMIEDHEGILLKVEGDSLLVIFRNAYKAMQCTVAMQQLLRQYNIGRHSNETILLSVGLGYGRVLRIGDHDVFGAEVNAASKLGEDIGKGGEILVTGPFMRACGEFPGALWTQMDDPPAGTDTSYRVDWHHCPSASV